MEDQIDRGPFDRLEGGGVEMEPYAGSSELVARPWMLEAGSQLLIISGWWKLGSFKRCLL